MWGLARPWSRKTTICCMEIWFMEAARVGSSV